jgi:hypothetical protein
MLDLPLPLDRATTSAPVAPAAGVLCALMLYGPYNVFHSSTSLDAVPGSGPAAMSWLWGWLSEL